MSHELPEGVVAPPAPPSADDLAALIEESSPDQLGIFVRLLHPADLAEVFAETDPRLHWPKVIAASDDARLSGVLSELEGGAFDDLVLALPDARLARLVGHMDSDDAADVILELPEALRERLVGALETRDALAVQRLLQYAEDSAGGIMQTELCTVRDDADVAAATAEVRRRAADLGHHLHAVFVIDPEGRLVGQLPLHALVISPDQARVADVMELARYQVAPEVDQEEVALLFSKYDLVVLPVVDHEGHLLGRILIDDVVDVLEEEVDEDVMRMVGASEEDLVYSDRILRISAYRLPWLVITLFGGLTTGWILWRFEATLNEVLALITFVPVITGMGGNVGTQSSTILTRGFATGRVDADNIRRVFLKELVIGLTMGATCGGLVAGAAILWHGQVFIGVVVGIAMLVAMTTAATIGTLAPATFKRLNIDPAIASGPFVTTANDIAGILIYLGAATLLLRYWHP